MNVSWHCESHNALWCEKRNQISTDISREGNGLLHSGDQEWPPPFPHYPLGAYHLEIGHTQGTGALGQAIPQLGGRTDVINKENRSSSHCCLTSSRVGLYSHHKLGSKKWMVWPDPALGRYLQNWFMTPLQSEFPFSSSPWAWKTSVMTAGQRREI